MIRKQLVAAVAASSLLLIACGDDGNDDATSAGSDGDVGGEANGTLKIGYVSTLSGPASFLGEAPRRGAAIAIEEINDGGGVCGYEFSLTAEDDELDPAKGVAAAQKLISQDDVSVIIGASHSGVSLAMSTVTEQAEIPQISPLSALLDLTNPVKPYFFRLWNNDGTIAQTLAEYASENYDQVGLIFETTAFGQGGRDALTSAFEAAGGNLVGTEAFDLAAQDLTPQLLKLREAGAEAIIVQSQGPQAALAAKNLEQLGYDAPIIGHPGLAQQGFVDLSEGSAEGSIVIDGLDREKPEAADFIESYTAEYGEEPFSFYPATGFDAVYLIAAGLENADCDPSALRDGLEAVDGFTGAVGGDEASISYDADDHDGYGQEALIFKTIEGDALVPVPSGD